MKSRMTIILNAAGSCVEVSWLYAWAIATMLAATHRPFPFVEALSSFILASLITGFSAGKGFRVVYLVAFHAAGFACIALKAVHVTGYSAYPFFDTAWLGSLFSSPGGFPEWTRLILVLFWTLMFWLSGAAHARRARTYYAVCSRFDIGLAAFFCLFLLKLALLVKGNQKIDDGLSAILAPAFLFFSLFAIGISKIQGDGLKGFLPGYRGMGLIAGLMSLVLFFFGGLVLFLMPALGAAAQGANAAIKTVAGSSMPFIEWVLRVVFRAGGVRPEPPAAPPRGTHEWSLSPWFEGSRWAELVEKALGWGMMGMSGALLIGGLAVAVFVVVKWLWSRTGKDKAGGEQNNCFFDRLKSGWDLLMLTVLRATRFVKGYRGAAEVYGVLLRWSSRTGISPMTSETPSEFGHRLQSFFPRLGPEIDLIVKAYNKEVYGEEGASGLVLANVGRAVKMLLSPAYWPLRLKARFLGVGKAKTG